MFFSKVVQQQSELQFPVEMTHLFSVVVGFQQTDRFIDHLLHRDLHRDSFFRLKITCAQCNVRTKKIEKLV